MRIAAVIAAALLLLAPDMALAQRSQADCDKLTNDDAYNRCLASFGPKRGQHVPSNSTAFPEATDAPPRSGAKERVGQGAPTRASRGSGRRAIATRGLRGNGHTVIVTPLKGGRLRFQIVMPQRR